MKTMIRSFIATAIALVVAGPAHAQSIFDKVVAGEPTVANWSAIQTGEPGLLVKYVGSNSLGGTVTVAAGGDITFSVGAVGSSAVSTALECPVSGALGGIIDVSDTACNTIGEVLDIVNASGDWVAVPIGLLRTDSSNNTLTALSEAAANAKEGLAVYTDQNVGFNMSLPLLPNAAMNDINWYMNRDGTLANNPFAGYRTVLYKATFNTTYGSGASNYYVYAVKRDLNGGAETVVTLWGPQAGGATTVDGTIDFTGVGGLFGPSGWELIVRSVNTEAMTAATGISAGMFFPH